MILFFVVVQAETFLLYSERKAIFGSMVHVLVALKLEFSMVVNGKVFNGINGQKNKDTQKILYFMSCTYMSLTDNYR